MKRLALLIGTTGKKEDANYLAGVPVDLKNYYSYLISPEGGAWEPEEIVTLLNPTRQEFLDSVANLQVGYLFMLYSGKDTHKAIYGGRTYFELNEDEIIDMEDVARKAPKQLILVHAKYRFSKKNTATPLFKTKEPQLTKEIARIRFTEQLQLSDDGTVLCSMIDYDRHAPDTSQGGFLSTHLLNSSYTWINKKSDANVLCIDLLYKNTLDDFFSEAKTNAQPFLRCSPPIRKNWFPIAVR